MSTTQKKSRKRRSVSSFTILLAILIVLALVTVAMAAAGAGGVAPATADNVATAPVKGFTDALPVCLFVLILGGFLGIVTETEVLDAGIAALVERLRGNELALIPILMFLFSIGGTTFGMCEETVPFYLLLAATMVAAGFDSMVGAAVVLLGAGCGVLGSTVNPFAVGAAIDSLSGTGLAVNQAVVIGLGAVLWLVTLGISVLFVMRYARKVKANKGSTILSLQERETMRAEFGEVRHKVASAEADGGETGDDAARGAKAREGATTMTRRQKWVLVAFGITFVVMIVGFVPWEDFGIGVFAAGGWSAALTGLPLGRWYFDDASTWFLVMALVIGAIGGVSEGRFVKAFIGGAADMMSVVLIIALARSITVLMGETGLDMWILQNAAHLLEGVSAVVFAPLSFLLYVVLSFLIPSSSGMATVSMPIMAPLASHLGFSVEVMIMVFSAGNGLVNLFTPTNGAIMGGLALAKLEYSTWLKFGAKLFAVLGVVCIVVLAFAMMFVPGSV